MFKIIGAGFWLVLIIGLFIVALGGCGEKIMWGEPVFGVPPGPAYDEDGYQLIMDFEVGGGQTHYERYLSHPTWPGYASGVTIGIGYDLGYSVPGVIHRDWQLLPFEERARLASTSGVTGKLARLLVPSVNDIFVPWQIAKGVYDRVTIGRYWQMTKRAFPGVEALCPKAQWACMSIVFNRGSSVAGERRREMREMRDAVERRDYTEIAHFNRASCRIWVGTEIERGMQRRRFAESALIERCM